MNGQKIFEKLSAMTEEERKQCCFWWLYDKDLIKNLVEQISFDMKDFVDEKSLEEVSENINPNDVAIMSDDLLEEVSEYSFDTFWDEASGLIIQKLENYMRDKLKGKGVEVPEF